MIRIILFISLFFALYSVLIHFWYDSIPFIFRPFVSVILANLTALCILTLKYKLLKK